MPGQSHTSAEGCVIYTASETLPKVAASNAFVKQQLPTNAIHAVQMYAESSKEGRNRNEQQMK